MYNNFRQTQTDKRPNSTLTMFLFLPLSCSKFLQLLFCFLLFYSLCLSPLSYRQVYCTILLYTCQLIFTTFSKFFWIFRNIFSNQPANVVAFAVPTAFVFSFLLGGFFHFFKTVNNVLVFAWEKYHI